MTPAQVALLINSVADIRAARAEKRELMERERAVFANLKSKGLESKAVREVLKRETEDADGREAFEAVVFEYERALGDKKAALEAIESGASINEAAKAHGIRRASLQALVGTKTKNMGRHKNSISVPPHDADGVIIESGRPGSASPTMVAGPAEGTRVAPDTVSAAAPSQSPTASGDLTSPEVAAPAAESCSRPDEPTREDGYPVEPEGSIGRAASGPETIASTEASEIDGGVEMQTRGPSPQVPGGRPVGKTCTAGVAPRPSMLSPTAAAVAATMRGDAGPIPGFLDRRRAKAREAEA